MKHFRLLLVLAICSLPAAWAVAEVTDAREHVEMSDDELFGALALAISGLTSGGISPQASTFCEGTAICRQTVPGGCFYGCFGEAAGDYLLDGCSGEVGLALCKFQGGSSDCTVRCIPNPF